MFNGDPDRGLPELQPMSGSLLTLSLMSRTISWLGHTVGLLCRLLCRTLGMLCHFFSLIVLWLCSSNWCTRVVRRISHRLTCIVWNQNVRASRDIYVDNSEAGKSEMLTNPRLLACPGNNIN
jgi:hypothetical protein